MADKPIDYANLSLGDRLKRGFSAPDFSQVGEGLKRGFSPKIDWSGALDHFKQGITRGLGINKSVAPVVRRPNNTGSNASTVPRQGRGGSFDDRTPGALAGLGSLIDAGFDAYKKAQANLPSQYQNFEYNGPTQQQIFDDLWGKYSGAFQNQRNDLDTRRQRALSEIARAYTGAQGQVGENQTDLNAVYDAAKANNAEAAAAAQAAINTGASNVRQDVNDLYANLGITEGVDQNQAVADQQRYIADSASRAQEAAASNEDRRITSMEANTNLRDVLAQSIPEQQAIAGSNFDSLLAELADMERQYQNQALGQANSMYNNYYNQALGEYDVNRQNYWDLLDRQQQDIENRRYAQQLAMEQAAAQNQPFEIPKYGNDADKLMAQLHDAGVSNSKATEWLNRMQQAANARRGTIPLEWFMGSSVGDILGYGGGTSGRAALQEYAKAMGWM